MATPEAHKPYDPKAAEFIHNQELAAEFVRGIKQETVEEQEVRHILSKVEQDLDMGVNMLSEQEAFKKKLLKRLERAYLWAHERRHSP